MASASRPTSPLPTLHPSPLGSHPPPSISEQHSVLLHKLWNHYRDTTPAAASSVISDDCVDNYMGMAFEEYHPIRNVIVTYPDGATENIQARMKSEGGSKIMKGALHIHPNSIIQCSPELVRLMEIVENAVKTAPRDHPSIRKGEKLLSYWTSANSLKQIHRWLCHRQPSLYEDPRTDGTNLRGFTNPPMYRGFHDEYVLRKQLIRALHYRGMTIIGKDGIVINYDRIWDLVIMYSIGRYMLEEEVANTNIDIGPGLSTDQYSLEITDPDEPNLRWISESRRIILDMLEAVKDLGCTPMADWDKDPRTLTPLGPDARMRVLDENVHWPSTELLDRMLQVCFPRTGEGHKISPDFD
jgi:hypothetical protein